MPACSLSHLPFAPCLRSQLVCSNSSLHAAPWQVVAYLCLYRLRVWFAEHPFSLAWSLISANSPFALSACSLYDILQQFLKIPHMKRRMSLGCIALTLLPHPCSAFLFFDCLRGFIRFSLFLIYAYCNSIVSAGSASGRLHTWFCLSWRFLLSLVWFVSFS